MILYYITDRTQFSGPEAVRQERLLERIMSAAEAGVDYVQLREKDLPDDALEVLAHGALERIRRAGTHTRLLVNSRIVVAASAGAHGVHLPAPGANIAAAKDRYREHGMAPPLIGVSCHLPEEAVSARTRGADFAIFGPVFEKSGLEKPGCEKKDGTGVGVGRLREACAVVAEWPVLAIGGITLNQASACLRVGAAGIAGIRLFQAGDLAQTVAELRRSTRSGADTKSRTI